MVECAMHMRVTHFARTDFTQMQHGLFADIEPIAEMRERRPLADPQTDDIDIEIAQRVECASIGSQVEVVETSQGHKESSACRRQVLAFVASENGSAARAFAASRLMRRRCRPSLRGTRSGYVVRLVQNTLRRHLDSAP